MQKNALDDPYLRATFAFLTSPSEKYESVLVANLINLVKCSNFS